MISTTRDGWLLFVPWYAFIHQRSRRIITKSSGVARAFPGGRAEGQNEEENEKSLRKSRKNLSKFEEKMREVELLPTLDCEAGYSPDQKFSKSDPNYALTVYVSANNCCLHHHCETDNCLLTMFGCYHFICHWAFFFIKVSSKCKENILSFISSHGSASFFLIAITSSIHRLNLSSQYNDLSFPIQ